MFGRHVLDGPVRLALGALEVDVAARPPEWRFAPRWGDELDRAELGPCPAPLPPDARRAAMPGEPALEVAPALADVDAVVRAEPPIAVEPGARIEVYVGTPLWLVLRAGGQDLADLPCVPIRRTWFGPTVREGEILLSMRTAARLHLEDLPRRPHRAATVLRVTNRDARPFVLERLRLPLPHLALWRAASGLWWTDAVEVTRDDGSTAATLRVAPRPPEAAGEVARVAEPRRREAPNPVLRALDALFS